MSRWHSCATEQAFLNWLRGFCVTRRVTHTLLRAFLEVHSRLGLSFQKGAGGEGCFMPCMQIVVGAAPTYRRTLTGRTTRPCCPPGAVCAMRSAPCSARGAAAIMHVQTMHAHRVRARRGGKGVARDSRKGGLCVPGSVGKNPSKRATAGVPGSTKETGAHPGSLLCSGRGGAVAHPAGRRVRAGASGRRRRMAGLSRSL